MNNHDFCRALLVETMKEVRKHTTPAFRRAAWAYNFGDGCREFQITGVVAYEEAVEGMAACSFKEERNADGKRVINSAKHCHYGQACCNYAIRVAGWEKFLRGLPHHITIGGDAVCERTGSIAGRETIEKAGVNLCRNYPDSQAAEEDADKLRPFYLDGVVEVVTGECPVSIQIERDPIILVGGVA